MNVKNIFFEKELKNIKNDMNILSKRHKECILLAKKFENLDSNINIYLIDLLKDFNRKNILIFAADKMGEAIFIFITEFNKKMYYNINIEAFVDSDPNKWGTKFCGKQVIKPSIEIIQKADKLIVASGWREIITEQFITLGVDFNKIFTL